MRGSRRGIMKAGLAGAAGIVAGHSILKTNALAAEVDEVSVKIPHVHKGENYKHQILESLAPVVSKIAESGGLKLSDQDKSRLHEAIMRRGEVTIPFREADSGYSLVTYSK